ncbi:aminopeptidase [Marinobacter sp. BGYM27]|uniref:aminopeptidase n=1 Tax=Marinobacter sp. BGYM27 TaxID=2975597 RepID=UPI0021A8104B|nr:aminopeptidase [Marinobacter sp. BGYM27]MDG5500985.1 aminopeptidase [Marinobacter sp. BGYM27]
MYQLSQIYLLSLLIFSLTGCSGIHYYQQAVTGQMTLLWDRTPIEDVLDDPATDEALQQKLNLAIRARQFAGDNLALPVDGTFSSYVELNRPYVVYNLVIAPRFSLAPQQWCYPVIGCQAYRGFFHLEDAQEEMSGYPSDEYDRFIGGVSAYSTLGWFDDPLHSGFTNLPDDRMVALIFHELAHKVVYVDGDTTFNESFATTVELEGLKRWLIAEGQPETYNQANVRWQMRRDTIQLVEQTSEQLNRLYQAADTLPEQTLMARKQALLEALKTDYAALETRWGEPGPLGGLVDQANNAIIGLLKQYNGDVPAFQQLLKDSNGDFLVFFDKVRALAELDAEPRRQQLDNLRSRQTEPAEVTTRPDA